MASGEDLARWHGALSAFDAGRARVLKQDGGVLVLRAILLGRGVVVKSWECVGFLAQVKRVLRVSRADRHWRGAAWLGAHGVATGEPIALAWGARSRPRRQWLVMRDVPGATVLEVLSAGRAGVREMHALARAVGVQVARVVNAGRFNRDHKPSNLIVERLEADGAEIAVIDCVAVRRCAAGNRLAARWMLKTLVVEPHGCGCLPRRAVMMRAMLSCLSGLRGGAPVGRRERRWMWEKVTDAFQAHGETKPRVAPV